MAFSIYAKRIEWGDCDPAGIVFNPRYFEWFDAATADLFRQGGIDKQLVIKRWGVVIPLVETKAQFRKPCSFGEVVTIQSRVAEYGRSSFKIEHLLKNSDDEVCVVGNETRVCASFDPDDKSKLKSAAIPAEITALFDRLKGE